MTAYGTLYSGRPEQFSDTEREFLKSVSGYVPQFKHDRPILGKEEK